MVAPDCRRIIYRSRSSGGDGRSDLAAILASSRRNNGVDGVSGLLWTDGERFVQLLEGPPESVGLTFDRIRYDPRHRGVEVVEDGVEPERVFGDWSMANLLGDTDEDDYRRLAFALLNAPGSVRTAFEAG